MVGPEVHGTCGDVVEAGHVELSCQHVESSALTAIIAEASQEGHLRGPPWPLRLPLSRFRPLVPQKQPNNSLPPTQCLYEDVEIRAARRSVPTPRRAARERARMEDAMSPPFQPVARHQSWATTMIGVAALVTLAQPVALARPQDDASVLQKQGIATVNQYIDQFRRTGDRSSLLPQLQQAEREPMASYEGFVAAGDLAAAALSAITLGDIERMQDRWDPARALYGRARALALQARNSGYQARALTGLARTELLGGGNLSAASDRLGEAIRLATEAGTKDYLFDALDFAAQVEIKRGDLAAASAYLDRALALSGELEDKAKPLYGYLDRADVYLKRAEKCDYERSFDLCYDALNLARADYEQALRRAQDLGFSFLAQDTRGFLQEVEQRRALIRSQQGFQGRISAAALFHPKQASDVTINPHFLPGPDSALLGPMEAMVRQQPGLINSTDPRGAYVDGMLQQLRGNDDAALAAFLKAVELLERDRRNLRDEQSRGTFLEDKIEFYYAPTLQLLERRRLAQAFALLERSRSRAMADLLASRPLALGTGPERELFAASVKLRADIAVAQRKVFGLVASGGREKHADEIAALETQIGGREAQYHELQARMGREAPRLADLMVSEPVTLEGAQRAAAAGGYDLLYYLVLEHAVILWHINGAGAQVWNVFFPRTEVMKHVAALRDNLVDRARNERATFDEQTSR